MQQQHKTSNSELRSPHCDACPMPRARNPACRLLALQTVPCSPPTERENLRKRRTHYINIPPTKPRPRRIARAQIRGHQDGGWGLFWWLQRIFPGASRAQLHMRGLKSQSEKQNQRRRDEKQPRVTWRWCVLNAIARNKSTQHRLPCKLPMCRSCPVNPVKPNQTKTSQSKNRKRNS
jgi:hypothetical protein